MSELRDAYGEYPAKQWIYGLPWNSAESCREMGDSLTQAVHMRSDIADWLLSERLPEWDLALLTVSESHSVIEGMWHGVDETHPLHCAPSGTIAGIGVKNVSRGSIGSSAT